MWQVLFDKFYLLEYTRLHEQFLLIIWHVLFICQWTLRLHEHFLFENKRLETGNYGWWNKEKLPILCVVYTDIFLYVTIFICHIKTNTPVFQQI